MEKDIKLIESIISLEWNIEKYRREGQLSGQL